MRPHIRVHADRFNTTQTVSGAQVVTAVLTWYRNGQRFLPPMRELLHVIERGF